MCMSPFVRTGAKLSIADVNNTHDELPTQKAPMIPPTAAGTIGTEFMIAYLASTANTKETTQRYPQKLYARFPSAREAST